MANTSSLAAAISLKKFWDIDNNNSKEEYCKINFFNGQMKLYIQKDYVIQYYDYIVKQNRFYGDITFPDASIELTKDIDTEYIKVLNEKMDIVILKGSNYKGEQQYECIDVINLILQNPIEITQSGTYKYTINLLTLSPKYAFEDIIVPDHIESVNDFTFGISNMFLAIPISNSKNNLKNALQWVKYIKQKPLEVIYDLQRLYNKFIRNCR